MAEADVVIVGTGHGGAQTAIALRQRGFDGSIMLVGRDDAPPYERPPLSKDYLMGKKPFERLLIRPPAFWAERDVELRLRTTVTRLDPSTRTLGVAGGGAIRYGTLVWAAGGDPRRLACPGAQLSGIHTLRDKADADRLIGELRRGLRRVVVVGGGYVGLEAAAALVEAECQVTLVESRDRLLSRVAGEDLSRFFEAEHQSRGATLHLSTEIEAIEGEENDQVRSVLLASGEEIHCDILVVGIGIVPAVGPLIAAGAAGANGVDVDEFCRTSLPHVYAIGDCAAHSNAYAGGAVLRLESVQNAHDMAKVVAGSIMGEPHPYDAVPWFWSNQYDLRLQSVGLNLDHDATVLRGDPEDRSFSVIYMKDGRMIAIDCVNAVKDYVQGRKLVEARAAVDPERLLDPATPLL